MNSKAAMFSSTLQADPDAVCNTDPLWAVSTTVKTALNRPSNTAVNWLVPLWHKSQTHWMDEQSFSYK